MSNQAGNRTLANFIFIFIGICISCNMYHVFDLNSRDVSIGSAGFSILVSKRFEGEEDAPKTTTTAESSPQEQQSDKVENEPQQPLILGDDKELTTTSGLASASAFASLNNNHTQGEEMPFRKWAYVFIAGGCSRENRQHSGFIANIAISAKTLHDHNSTADVVVIVQMSYDSKHDTLSDDETKFLEASPNVKIKYLPRFGSKVYENFYALMMEKFQVLGLVEYSRVLFLDSDAMPVASLDHIFDLSEPLPENGPAVLEENFIIRWSAEPAAGGFFMLKPSAENYRRSQEIILETEKKALDLPWPHFDEVEGFGHKIVPPDKWQGLKPGEEGTNWTWHGAFADQGFLYHW